MRIVELLIDEIDNISGFDAVALVNSPAHEAGFHAFNNQDIEDAIVFQVIKMAMEELLEKEEFESYTDYPKQATENAKIALRWVEENGWGDCGTAVGKARANQLAKGEPISEETISRMAAFERHRQNSDKELGDGCGRLMWLCWGGDAGIEWAQRKLQEIKDGMSEEFSHYEDLPIDVQDRLLERLASVGISMETLAKEGYEIVDEEEFKKSQEFSVNSSDAKPDLTTNQTRGGYKVLYSYKVKPGEGPSIQNNSRDFCIDLIGMNLLFRKEDIDRLTIKGANSEEFGYYDIFKYKGSFNCRHQWKEVYVRQKEETITDRPGLNIANILKNLGVGAGQVEETTKPGNLRGDSPIVSFSKENFSFQEDQQIVVGPLMLPNKLIFRVDENEEPYFVYFSEDTIKQIAGKMMKNKLLDKVNMEHDPDSPVDGYMLESWVIEDPLKDKQQIYGMSYPKGTWMGAYKIEDKEVWEGVKAGKFTGYSIEGFFADRLIQK